MAKRADFGSDWSEFVEAWCLGIVPSMPSDSGWEALGVLERLWPEYLDSALVSGKGVWTMLPVLDVGLVLRDCARLEGFDGVFERMKTGAHPHPARWHGQPMKSYNIASTLVESAAFSELACASLLQRLGYEPILEPRLNEKRPDACIRVGARDVYIEVICPELSSAMREVRQEVLNLSIAILEHAHGLSVSVFLFDCPVAESSEAILNCLKECGPSKAFYELPGLARIACSQSGEHLPCSMLAPDNLSQPVSTSESADTLGARVSVCYVETDERAQRLMDEESKHLSLGEMNLLVMDVSTIPRALQSWPALVQRRFQPKINRRFGAVVLLERCCGPREVELRCVTLENPHARKPLPRALLDGLGMLNKSGDSRSSGG